MVRTILLLFPVVALAQVGFPIFFNPVLGAYLKLSDAQVQEIARNNAQYAFSQTATFERINALNGEIGLETQKSAPDTAALGGRYREIEVLCRQNETPLRNLHQQQMRVLNDEQRVLLRGLQDYQRNRLLAFSAEALFLIPPRTLTQANFPVVFNGTPYRGLSISPFFSAASLIEVNSDLTVYLGLSAVQLDRIRQSLRAYQEFFAARDGRMTEVSREIQVELARDDPSAAEVGVRYWEIEAHRRQIAERESELRRELAANLTAPQTTKLQSLVQPDSFEILSAWAMSLNLILPESLGRPATRASGVNVTVSNTTGLRFVSSFFFGDPSTYAVASIYRTCHAGPEYEYRIGLGIFPGGLNDPAAARRVRQ